MIWGFLYSGFLLGPFEVERNSKAPAVGGGADGSSDVDILHSSVELATEAGRALIPEAVAGLQGFLNLCRVLVC